jgi:hypothetical protein
MMKWILLLVILFFSLSCAVNQNEEAGPVFCTIDQTETYNLGLDPSADTFDVLNLVRTTTFNSTDCPQVQNVPLESFVSRVQRQGQLLSIYERQFTPGQFLLEMTIVGTTLLPVENLFNINNCSIIRRWSGTLDTPRKYSDPE